MGLKPVEATSLKLVCRPIAPKAMAKNHLDKVAKVLTVALGRRPVLFIATAPRKRRINQGNILVIEIFCFTSS